MRRSSGLASASSGSNHTGDGTIEREEEIKLKLAALARYETSAVLP